jgi:hypothetical protein
VTIADDLEVVASYDFPYEADLARALLEAHDIPAWVVDALQVQQRWAIARAIGGVKVAVRRDDVERSRALLAEDHSAKLAALPESQLPAAPDETCPRCGSPASRSSRKRLWPGWLSFFLSFAVTAPIRRTRVDYECGRCRSRWSRVGG